MPAGADEAHPADTLDLDGVAVDDPGDQAGFALLDAPASLGLCSLMLGLLASSLPVLLRALSLLGCTTVALLACRLAGRHLTSTRSIRLPSARI